jgi:hypothetical protein
MAPGMGLGGAPMMGPAVTGREAPWGVFPLVFLVFTFLILSFSGMMMYDLMRQMWNWSGPYAVNEAIANPLVGLFD